MSLNYIYDNNLCFFGGRGLVTNHVWLLRPHGLQPASLLCPWDFPCKNTGMGFHFLPGGLLHPGIKPASPTLQADAYRCTIMCCVVLVAKLCPTLCDPVVSPWNSLHKNTGVGGHSLLQEIFLTQGLNRGLLHCKQMLFFFTIWATREAPKLFPWKLNNTENRNRLFSVEWCIILLARPFSYFLANSNMLLFMQSTVYAK